MNKEQLQYYRDLLTKYKAYILFDEETDLNIEKLQDEVEALVEQEPEFENLLLDVEGCYWFRAIHKKFLLRPIQDSSKKLFFLKRPFFLKRKPTEFDDSELECFVDLYLHDPEFRNACDANKALRKIMPSWVDEYHRRVADNEGFARRILLGKLGQFTLGKLGLEKPVGFDENERTLLIRLYHTDAEFREICDNHNIIVREAIASWLKERQRKNLED
jgi:hypothetical protein